MICSADAGCIIYKYRRFLKIETCGIFVSGLFMTGCAMQNISFKTVYEDDSLLLVDKPQGLATAPGKQEHLCSVVFDCFPLIKKVKGYHAGEGGLLNRLDNDTGGIVFFAKSDKAFLYYSQLMKAAEVEKVYTAIVSGQMKDTAGVINQPLMHHPKNKKKMTAGTRGRGKPRASETRWKILKRGTDNTLLQLTIRKGARHQIRVHLALSGHPLVGDKLYNKIKYPGIEHHLLYASGVRFTSACNGSISQDIAVPFLNYLK